MAVSKPKDLREACVAEALRIIEESGIEGLSIREVARRLSVSHQAPYKHFPSSDHLLAEVVRRTYIDFAQHLQSRPRSTDPGDDMASLGWAYFQFAQQYPLRYRLIFGTPLPDPSAHPEMMEEARAAFQILLSSLERVPSAVPREKPQLDALFVWATVHGLSTILQSRALAEVGVESVLLQEAFAHTLFRIGRALQIPPKTG
jgi:AcrR family transcriptional regulator